jgi:hypothetical protein
MTPASLKSWRLRLQLSKVGAADALLLAFAALAAFLAAHVNLLNDKTPR